MGTNLIKKREDEDYGGGGTPEANLANVQVNFIFVTNSTIVLEMVKNPII